MVFQDICEGHFAFGGVEVGQVDVGIGERLVGRCEQRERACALEGGEQVGLDNGCHKGVVYTGGLRYCVDVSRRQQHLVNDVDDAVGGLHVGDGDVGPVDGDPCSGNTKLDPVVVDGCGQHAVTEIG